MKKKVVCLLLATLIVLATVTILPLTISAAEELTTWSALQSAINETSGDATTPATATTNFILTGDLTAPEQDGASITIPAGKDITLDLNGKVLNANGGAFSVIEVQTGGKLTVIDSAPTTEHKGYVDANGLWHLGEPQNGETVKNITGGVITGGKSQKNGGGVYVNGGSFTMNGGNLAGNTTASKYNGGGVYNNGTFNMTGGNIVGNTADYYGGGVYNNGTFNMTGGNIVGNTADYYGGGVYNYKQCTFNMTGGMITGNTGDFGGGIFINGGDMTVYGGTICGNTAKTGGGGICTSKGSGNLTVYGGTICDNTSQYSGGIQNQGTLKFLAAEGKEITITGNTATVADGGVFNGGEMHLSGKVIIKDNICTTKYDETVNYPINLATQNAITIDGALTGSEIYITHANFDDDEHNTGVLTSGYTTKNTGAKLNDFFHYDGPSSFYMALESDELTVKAVSGSNYAVSIPSTVGGVVTADKQIAAEGDTVTVTVTPDEGYQLKALKYNDGEDHTITVDKDGKYTFTMPAKAVTVTAEFEAVLTAAEAAAIAAGLENNTPTTTVYSVTGYVTQTNGTISKGQQTFWLDDEKGDKKTFEGYWCNLPANEGPLRAGDKVTIVGNILRYNSTYEIKNGNVTILERAHSITNGTAESAKETNHGYIAIDKATAAENETVTITVKPNEGYQLKSLKYNDGEDHTITADKDGKYTFTMPAKDVTVTAEFEAATPASQYSYTEYENWQIKYGNDWTWSDNMTKVADGLFKIEILWEGTGFNVKSDENPIKKDWYAPEELTIADEVLAPVTVDVYLRIIDDETLKIGIGEDPAPAHTHAGTKQNGQPATETAAGYNDYYKCDCGLYFEDEDCTIDIGDETALESWKTGEGAIAKLVHTITPVSAQAATQTEAGFKAYYECKNCGKYYEDAEGKNEITDLSAWKEKGGNGYIPSGNEIATSKTEAKAALDSENAKDALTDETALTNGKSAIDSAETLADIENAKNAAITAIQEAQATELANAKTNAKNALDTEEAKDPLTDKTALTNGKNSIDEATTKAEVEEAKDAAIKAIQKAQASELANAKADAKAALDAEEAKAPLTDKTALTNGKNSIDSAATKAAVEIAKTNAITAIQQAQKAEHDIPEPPQDGDNSNMTLWVILMVLSSMGLCACLARGKKRNII